MADRRLTSLSQLSDTQWGRILTEKLGLVALLILLVALHSFWIGPSLRRLRERALAGPKDRQLEQRLHRMRMLTGIVNVLTLLAALAILVFTARLAGV